MNHHNLSPTGAIVFWSVGPTIRESLYNRLSQLGLADYMPAERTDAAALKSTLLGYCKDKKSRKADKVVQSHRRPKNNGFEVVDVERKEEVNDYDHAFSAKVEDGRVSITRGVADWRVLQDEFAKQKAMITGAGVGQMLVKLLATLEGVTLKPGTYWIPEEALATWKDVAAAVEGSAVEQKGSEVYYVKTVLDEAGCRAVRDAIIREITQEAATLGTEIAGGNLGDEALGRRKSLAASLHDRVRRYEGFLGEALDVLHQIVTVAEQAAASAVAVQESETAFAGVFG
jgi:hypothetical protein